MAENGKKLKKTRTLRLIIQCCFTALSNGYLAGFAKGEIYKGPLKYLCAPGLNCYSCPGAVASCPIGSLQSALSSHAYRSALYVLGFLTVFGSIGGRFVCGFLCPFGLIQDLLNKIPFIKKLRRLPGERFLRYLRYVILAVFVIILPLVVIDVTGLGKPWFCKYICPAGTLEGGVPLAAVNGAIRELFGFLFAWKFAILAVILLLSIIIYRPFCRYICPLGALYGLFNRFAVYRYKIDKDKCVNCGKCRAACRLDIKVFENPNSADCIRCGECLSVCPTKAIKRVHPFKK